MAYVPNSNSVVAFQGTVPWSVLGAVTTTGSVISVQQGSVAAVIIGGSIATSFTPPVNQSVSGTVNVGNFPTNQNVGGSVVAFQGGAPWANAINGSVATVIIGGSIAANFTPPANQSVSGTVGASIIGLVPVAVSNFPTTQNVSGSVVAFQGGTWNVFTAGSVAAVLIGSINQSVSGTVGASIVGQLPAGTAMLGSVTAYQGATPWAVAGSIAAFQAGTQITSLVSTVPSSVIVGASIFGQIPAGTAMIGSITAYQGAVPWVMVGSVYGNVAGSVVAFQGTSPWVVNFQNSSVLAVPVGSTITIIQNASIAGTYAEDSGHTNGDRGLLHFGVRNDTVSSFTSNNTDYGPVANDSAGRLITKPFAAGEASLISVTSIVSAGTIASVQLFPAPGAGLKNYITDFNIANSGATTTVVLFADSDSSVLGRTIAPSGGGSNGSYQTPIASPRVNTVTNLHILSSSSIVYATVTGFKAP